MDIKAILSDVLSVAGSVTGIGLLKDASDALKGTDIPPEKQVELQEKIQANVIHLFEDEIADRANARAREIALAQAGAKDATVKQLAIGTTFGFFGILIIMIFVPMNPTTQSIVNIMVGALGASWGMIISYYFGSSSGSKEKDSTIKLMAQNGRGVPQ